MSRPKNNYAGVANVLEASGISLDALNWQAEGEAGHRLRTVNLTYNDVTVFDPGKTRPILTLRRGDRVARCVINDQRLMLTDDGEGDVRRYGHIYLASANTGRCIGDGLIPEVPGTLYLVSLAVLNHMPRRDFIAPDTRTSSAVKDAEGRLLGVTRFLGVG